MFELNKYSGQQSFRQISYSNKLNNFDQLCINVYHIYGQKTEVARIWLLLSGFGFFKCFSARYQPRSPESQGLGVNPPFCPILTGDQPR